MQSIGPARYNLSYNPTLNLLAPCFVKSLTLDSTTVSDPPQARGSAFSAPLARRAFAALSSWSGGASRLL